MMDMEDRSRTFLPPIISSPGAVSSSTRRSSIQRNCFDLIASEEPLSLRQQVEHYAPLEQTVTTQPSSRVAPQWLQPLNRGAPEGCEASREKPRWLVPQNSAEPKSAASMLPDLPCNPGRVCRGVEKSVNGGPWKANSLDLSCDLLEDLKGEPKPDRPISGRRSSFRNTSRQTEEQHLRTASLSNAGQIDCHNLCHIYMLLLQFSITSEFRYTLQLEQFHILFYLCVFSRGATVIGHQQQTVPVHGQAAQPTG